ncbi:MAG: iron ABC transporter permease [Verrucomicrobia bacterium]|nr:iron ABC transporter permease [Verrucomicrobiota bacterium]
MSKNTAYVIYGLTLIFFCCFFLWPIAQILKGGFVNADGVFTLVYFFEVFANPIYLEGLRNAFIIAFLTTCFSFLISVPLAFASDRYEFSGKSVLQSLLLVPIILPPFVGAIGVKQIFGQYGAVNALLQSIGLLSPENTIDWIGANPFWGIVFLNTLHLYPIIYLNAVAALANIDPNMEEAAENLGCTGLNKFRKITLPLIRPGLFAGGTIVFIWAFTELGVPLIFDYSRVTSVQIYYGIKDIGGSPFPYALVAAMLMGSILIYALGKGIFGRTSYAMMAKATHSSGLRKLSKPGTLLCCLGFLSVIGFATLPHLGVVILSFAPDWYASILPSEWTLANYELALGHTLTVSSIANSLKYASIATLFDLFLGICIAYVLVRSKVPGKAFLDALAMLPLAVPGLVLAFGYLAMSQEGKFFAFLNPIENPTFLLIIAYAIRRLPYIVRSAVAGFEQSSETYEEAAQNLGCSPFKTVLKITLPLIMANLLAGALLSFSFAMLEVSDSLILAQKQAFYPITKAIYELFQLLGDGRFVASALGVWAMVFLAVCIMGASLILGKKLGAIFRV